MKKILRKRNAFYFLLELVAFTVLVVIAGFIIGDMEAQQIAEKYPNDWRRNFLAGTGWIIYAMLIWVVYLITWTLRIIMQMAEKVSRQEDLSFHLLLLLPALYIIYKAFSFIF